MKYYPKKQNKHIPLESTKLTTLRNTIYPSGRNFEKYIKEFKKREDKTYLECELAVIKKEMIKIFGYLIKDLSLEYIKHSQKSIIRKQITQ